MLYDHSLFVLPFILQRLINAGQWWTTEGIGRVSVPCRSSVVVVSKIKTYGNKQRTIEKKLAAMEGIVFVRTDSSVCGTYSPASQEKFAVGNLLVNSVKFSRLSTVRKKLGGHNWAMWRCSKMLEFDGVIMQINQIKDRHTLQVQFFSNTAKFFPRKCMHIKIQWYTNKLPIGKFFAR